MNTCPVVKYENDRQDKAARIQVPRCGEKQLERELENDQLIKKQTHVFFIVCLCVLFHFL